MKTITLSQFEALIERNDWVATQEHEIVENTSRIVEGAKGDDGLYEQVEVKGVWGWAKKVCALDGVEVLYHTPFNHDLYDSDSLAASENPETTWEVLGVIVHDEDGDAMGAEDLSDYIPRDSIFTDIDYSVLFDDTPSDIDVQADSGASTMTLPMDGEPDIRFTGQCIAKESSSRERDRWTELALYKTVGGNFVCHQIGHSLWEGERTRYSGKVCSNTAQVIEFFGQGWLAKELYDSANITNVIHVK